jgi:hypothetical protein
MGWFSYQHRWIRAYRNPGWFVERDGTRVALLTEPAFSDMFWYWWKIEPLSDDSEARAKVLSPEFWADEFIPRTTYANRDFGFEAHGFWADIQYGRILMRGLYQGVPASRRDRVIIRLLMWLGY